MGKIFYLIKPLTLDMSAGSETAPPCAKFRARAFGSVTEPLMAKGPMIPLADLLRVND
jgi:hypothetical protein